MSASVHFGGPESPPGHLRNLLAERIAAVPPGGAIDWVTYYFRDRRLAADLVRARERGVQVRVALDGRPRTPHANDAVVRLLRTELGEGLRVVATSFERMPLRGLWQPRLHEKLYCFSHPEPVAIVGSFNPSGDQPEEDPAVLREIGDQDRGYNLLIELRDRRLSDALVSHARRIHAMWHGPFGRFTASANRPLRSGKVEVHFWPRLASHPIAALLAGLGSGARVRLAASHLSGAHAIDTFAALPKRGVRVEIIAETTQRRVPTAAERHLVSAGAELRRLSGPEPVPMHDKYLLIDAAAHRKVVFGSFNWTRHSRLLNRELAVVAQDPELFEVFEARWESVRKLTS